MTAFSPDRSSLSPPSRHSSLRQTDGEIVQTLNGSCCLLSPFIMIFLYKRSIGKGLVPEQEGQKRSQEITTRGAPFVSREKWS